MAGAREAGSAVLLAASAGVVCVVSRARVPTEWDSAQLAAGVIAFDVRVHEPHPPGYWSYLVGGRLVRLLTGLQPHSALVVVSIAGAMLAVLVTYALGRVIAGPALGIAAGAVAAGHPLLLFYGSIAATYAWDAAASSTAVLLALLAATRERGWRYAAGCAATIGFLGGFRPSLVIFLAPLVLAAGILSRAKVRHYAVIALTGALAVATWLVPMAIEQQGGLAELRAQNAAMWSNAAHFTSPFFGAAPEMIETNVLRTIGWGLAALLPVVVAGAALTAMARSSARDESGAGRRRRVVAGGLVALVAVPQIASSLLLHFGKPGYTLGWLLPVVAVVIAPVSRLHGVRRLAGGALIGTIALLGVGQFLFGAGLVPARLTAVGPFSHGQYEAPFRATRREIRRADADTAAYATVAADHDAATTTFVVLAGAEGIRYRVLGHLFPDLTIHYLVDGFDWAVSSGGRQRYERDRAVEVDASKQIVLIGVGGDEVTSLAAAGRAMPVPLRSGGMTWVIDHGTTLEGVLLGRPRQSSVVTAVISRGPTWSATPWRGGSGA